MNRILLFAFNLSAFLSILLASMFPIASAYEVEYDSRWQILSGSMRPTLELLDTVYVKHVSGQVEVYSSYGDGDIILFYSPWHPSEFIIHRAVEKFQSDSIWYFKTKGDNNVAVDPWNVPESDVIGKIVALSRTETVASSNVTVFSSSAFTNFHLDPSLNAFELNVAMLLTQSASSSFLNITIPNELVTGGLDALVNGFSVIFKHSTNSTHHFVWFEWEGTDYTANIVLPEFPSLIILPLFIITTLLASVVYRRRHIRL